MRIRIYRGQCAGSRPDDLADERAAYLGRAGDLDLRKARVDVPAELSLPLSLTDAAVDPFPKQVRVAAVAGVFLNHVDQDRAQRRAAAVRLDALNA